MNRALLVAALAFSLWPIGAILVLSGKGEQTQTSPQAPLIRAGGEASPARPQLETIVSRAVRLDKRFGNAELQAGEPRMVFAYTAWSIEEDLRRWLLERRGVASGDETVVARKTIGLLRALGRLAERPTEKKLHIYDQAVVAFDAVVR